VEFAIQLHANWPIGEYARLAPIIEKYDFTELNLHDVQWRRPVWPILTVIAMHTTRVQIGPDVTNPYLRHPLITAGNIAVLDELSGGRAILGLGSGSLFEPLAMKETRPVATVRECALLVRRFLAGDPTPFQGEVFTALDTAVLQWQPPRKTIPIFLGAFGPNMLRLGGEIFDEVRPGTMWTPEFLDIVRTEVREGAARAGRDPKEVRVGGEIWLSLSRDREAAKEVARPVVAQFLHGLKRVADIVGIPGQERIVVGELVHAGKLREAARHISDHTLGTLMAVGTPAEIIEGIERMRAAGLEKLTFSGVMGPDPEAAIHLLGTEVLPRFR
jgi:5,10-methylenetetrahydromethanopterin reductase